MREMAKVIQPAIQSVRLKKGGLDGFMGDLCLIVTLLEHKLFMVKVKVELERLRTLHEKTVALKSGCVVYCGL